MDTKDWKYGQRVKINDGGFFGGQTGTVVDYKMVDDPAPQVPGRYSFGNAMREALMLKVRIDADGPWITTFIKPECLQRIED